MLSQLFIHLDIHPDRQLFNQHLHTMDQASDNELVQGLTFSQHLGCTGISSETALACRESHTWICNTAQQ